MSFPAVLLMAETRHRSIRLSILGTICFTTVYIFLYIHSDSFLFPIISVNTKLKSQTDEVSRHTFYLEGSTFQDQTSQ